MRKVITFVAVLVTFLAVLAPAMSANATGGTAETIVLLRNGETDPIGWSASGTFTDSGSWTDPFARAGGIPSPNVFQLEIKTVQTNRGGTGSFWLNFQGHLNLTTGRDFGGTWTISQGSGPYAGLHGHGTWSLAIDPISGFRMITCVGLVHFD